MSLLADTCTPVCKQTSLGVNTDQSCSLPPCSPTTSSPLQPRWWATAEVPPQPPWLNSPHLGARDVPAWLLGWLRAAGRGCFQPVSSSGAQTVALWAQHMQLLEAKVKIFCIRTTTETWEALRTFICMSPLGATRWRQLNVSIQTA